MAKDWEFGGDVDGEPAMTNDQGDRVDALWPLDADGKPADDSGHIATNDGLNASYLAEPGGEVVVDDNPRSTTYTGYSEGASDRAEMNAARMRDASRGQTRPTRRQRDEQKFYRNR